LALLVKKFGGTSVGDVDRIRRAARAVKKAVDRGDQVVVVVSAMSGDTNRLVGLTREASPLHDAREYDAVVASGEQVTIGLMSIVLQEMGVPARSFLGWQVPIKTNDLHGAARIEEIETENLHACLAEGRVAVVAGFQGVSDHGRITTLGRGGSDTSAVALAGALKAERCDIYTDVDGVYTTDPRIVPSARKLDRITYEEMLEMASLGAKVLQTRSVAMAMNHDVAVQVLSSFIEHDEELPGTLVVSEEEIVEQQVVSGIAYSRGEAKITVSGLPDKPGVVAGLFAPLTDAHINVDMIVQSAADDGAAADITFTIGEDDLARTKELLEGHQKELGFADLNATSGVAKVSIIGVGMRSHTGVASKMFSTLAEKQINVEVISTSEIKVSVLVDEAYTELAVRALHSAFDMAGAPAAD